MPEALMEVKDLKVHFPVQDGWARRDGRVVRAVDGISLRLYAGEVLAVVGESGCGKTTLGRTVAGLASPTSGTITFRGRDLQQLSTADRKVFRRQVQMVFQDPYDSMNPRKSAFQMIAQPLSINGIVPKSKLVDEVLRLFDNVGLSPGRAYLERTRHQLSGGERQRLSIARSISVNPSIIVADEPVSALDISIQGQILGLMRKLQMDSGISYLFISHDLAVVRSLADRVMIVYLGQIAEEGSTDDVFTNPRHPYTLALLAAHPIPDPKLSRKRIKLILTGDVPSPIDPPAGCRFHTRCPIAEGICSSKAPAMKSFADGHQVACHFADQIESKSKQIAAAAALDH
ncbi:MAG: ATP-binding cassette domain-containing protein [Rhodobacteraceae bacterium]|nr:ATP-binding cassette domain-containing protein [Paracoccaceae bacterium]